MIARPVNRKTIADEINDFIIKRLFLDAQIHRAAHVLFRCVIVYLHSRRHLRRDEVDVWKASRKLVIYIFYIRGEEVVNAACKREHARRFVIKFIQYVSNALDKKLFHVATQNILFFNEHHRKSIKSLILGSRENYAAQTG